MQIGDRVIMPDRPGIHPMETWPVQGSAYECEGTIIDRAPYEGRWVVEWDNGRRLANIQALYLKRVGTDSKYYENKKELNI